jgi:hypothetical protein
MTTLPKRSAVPREYCVTKEDNHRPRQDESRTGVADPEESTRNKKLPGLMHLLQTAYFRFLQYCETANQTHKRSKPSSGLRTWKPPSKHQRRPSVLALFSLARSQDRDSSLAQMRQSRLEKCCPKYRTDRSK